MPQTITTPSAISHCRGRLGGGTSGIARAHIVGGREVFGSRARPVKGDTSVIAFVEDPDGYKIEFIETKRA